MSVPSTGSAPVTFRIGHDEVVIRRRYALASIANDIAIGVWFTLGSVLFFSDATATTGTWLFVVGSVELLVRPTLRLARSIHLRRLPGRPPGAPTETDHDF